MGYSQFGKGEDMAGKLFVVATPIGNLGDISLRCRGILEQVDFVAAEDTRVTIKLLNHMQIKKPMVSYHEHNRTESGGKILARILAGENCALVSDAGTPAISDPGTDLVDICAGSGVEVIGIPGPCAMITALAVSGLPSGRFTFEGFLTTNKKNRREHLKSLVSETRTMVFYEAPHKLNATLRDLYAALGQRRISISRELTKIHEETLRTTLSDAISYFESNAPRGEFVLIVEGAQKAEIAAMSLEEAVLLVRKLQSSGMTYKDAVSQASRASGLSKNDIYNRAIEERK